MAELPVADVIWWDERKFCVLCPFCDEAHNHYFPLEQKSNRYARDITRVSHCWMPRLKSQSPGRYRLRFPFEKYPSTTGYEIDRTNRRFIAIGEHQDVLDEEDSLAEAMASKLHLGAREQEKKRVSIWAGTEEINISSDDNDTVKWTDLAISECILGSLAYVKAYLMRTEESHIFLHGADKDGKTILIMAAAEKFPDMVELLLEEGTDVNAVDYYGRSALMEAALWGRSENVEVLLAHGADKELRDNRGFCAIHLARPSKRNTQERWTRAGREYQMCKEDTYTADRARKLIVRMLGEPARASSSETTNSADLNCRSFHRSPQDSTIKLMAPKVSIPVTNRWKAVACLERSAPFEDVLAMSGWRHGEEGITVSGKSLTEEVFEISRRVGHHLSKDKRDQHRPGSFHACHAEKQLVAYLLRKHYVFSDDEALLPLWQHAPPKRLTTATILVSSEPCLDCRTFIAKVAAHCKVSISVRFRCTT